MPLQIVVCPTVREPDGLAVSSRNKYLTAQQKKDATLIYQSLRKCEELVGDGVTDTKSVIAEMRQILSRAPAMEIEYVSILDAETLDEIASVERRALAAVAVKLGKARLIDNILVDVGEK
jgi:pantoate--beta-alanine ligase